MPFWLFRSSFRVCRCGLGGAEIPLAAQEGHDAAHHEGKGPAEPDDIQIVEQPCAGGHRQNLGDQLHPAADQRLIGVVDAPEHLLVNVHYGGQEAGDGGNQQIPLDHLEQFGGGLVQEQLGHEPAAEGQQHRQHQADRKGEPQGGADAAANPLGLAGAVVLARVNRQGGGDGVGGEKGEGAEAAGRPPAAPGPFPSFLRRAGNKPRPGKL